MNDPGAVHKSTPLYAALLNVVRITQLLANDTRLEILLALGQREANVTTIAEELDLGVERVSAHLRTLHKGLLVASRRVGTQNIYQLSEFVDVTSQANTSVVAIDRENGCTVLISVQHNERTRKKTALVRLPERQLDDSCP
jgi:DNA-binding transcriptional ArsR family regulator